MGKQILPVAMMLVLGSPGVVDAKSRDRFDLVCIGRTQMNSWEHVDYGESTIRVRVNLKDGKYCIDDCKFVEAVARNSPEELVFYDNSKDLDYSSAIFDRAKSTLVQIKGHRQSPTNPNDFAYVARFYGNCRTARFSGFPKS